MAAFTDPELAYLNNQPLMRFASAPEVIWSWGINETSKGIPRMERRELTP